jgi:hypothetical protein
MLNLSWLISLIEFFALCGLLGMVVYTRQRHDQWLSWVVALLTVTILLRCADEVLEPFGIDLVGVLLGHIIRFTAIGVIVFAFARDAQQYRALKAWRRAQQQQIDRIEAARARDESHNGNWDWISPHRVPQVAYNVNAPLQPPVTRRKRWFARVLRKVW